MNHYFYFSQAWQTIHGQWHVRLNHVVLSRVTPNSIATQKERISDRKMTERRTFCLCLRCLRILLLAISFFSLHEHDSSRLLALWSPPASRQGLGNFSTMHLSYPGIVWRWVTICALQISRKGHQLNYSWLFSLPNYVIFQTQIGHSLQINYWSSLVCVKAIFFASLIWLRVLEAAFVLMPAERPTFKLDCVNI